MGNIRVGGDVTGSAVSTGDQNRQTVTYSGASAAERDEILAALQSIESALGELTGASAKSAQREAAAAVDAAKIEDANKDEIGSALETALGAAKRADEFVTIAGRLLPLVRSVAYWLGGQWASLVTLLP